MDLSGILMGLAHILGFSLGSVLISAVRSGKTRSRLLYIASILALYSLQPALALRQFDFWLPTAAIALAIWVWVATMDQQRKLEGEDRLSLAILAATLGLLILSSYLPQSLRAFVSLPLDLPDVTFGIILIGAVAWSIRRIKRTIRSLDILLIVLILTIFVGLKAPELSLELSRAAREWTGQSPDLASILDLNWLGFSYIAFRLIHVLRDHQSGRLPSMGFQSFLLYVFFFPALSAGPIDRAERFLKDLRQERKNSQWTLWWQGGARIVRGLFQKYILADSLALVALNASHINLVQSSIWLWVLLYLYSFRIYFDFSGYTDIAIGIGALSGIRLPENFNQPYRQADLGAFWNRWHITLAQWFRAYVFNPLTRGLRKGTLAGSPWLIILIGQLATMILIGLWHGITWNFFIWGLWHAVGLFIHNRWTEAQRKAKELTGGSSQLKRIRALGSWALTFNFVSLGWVWFSLPDMRTAWSAFLKLFGGSLG